MGRDRPFDVPNPLIDFGPSAVTTRLVEQSKVVRAPRIQEGMATSKVLNATLTQYARAIALWYTEMQQRQRCRVVGVAWQHVKVMSVSARQPRKAKYEYVERRGGMYSKKLGKYFAGLPVREYTSHL